MESITDFEKLLFLYKTEGHNKTIESFCMNNGVNYRAFGKWHRVLGYISYLRPDMQNDGCRVLKYFQSFFKTFKEGCRDFMNMLPGKLAID